MLYRVYGGLLIAFFQVEHRANDLYDNIGNTSLKCNMHYAVLIQF